VTRQAVFGNGRFSTVIQIFPVPTLVVMVRKMGLFLHKIGRNSACTNARAAEFKGDVHLVFSLIVVFAVYDVSHSC